MNNKRIHNRWPIAREGLPFVAVGLVAALVGFYFRLYPLGVLFALLTLFVLYFFRDPQRQAPATPGVILSPADGRILEVRPAAPAESGLDENATKISIFMSVFNVHVNRSPIDGAVARIAYHPGRFFAANLDKASHLNERNSLWLQLPGGKRILVVQIAGLIARRIACWVRQGDRLQAGQRFGLIRFGSRLETFVPAETSIAVRVGQQVQAGVTPLGYLT